MTIKIPKPSIADLVLRYIGKKRAIYISTTNQLGRNVDYYQIARYESFWTALLRPKGKSLPNGWVYPEDIFR